MIDVSTLNDAQREAVEHTEGPLLVLAGAGSGKTRVLTYRIAHIVEDLGCWPYHILAITFTNKAAAEMRSRLGELLGDAARGMWISTFHAMCVRMLRIDADRLGYTRDFTIYDEDDSKRLMKEVYAELGIDEKRFPLQTMRSRISDAKNELLAPGQLEGAFIGHGVPVALIEKAYASYQNRLKLANAMDFDDLLMQGWVLLSTCEDVLKAYQERFRYILVDEYQDTNHAQYEMVKLLAAGYGNIMVVGDDDQSIYSWRGADIRNILEFERDFTGAHTVMLERNYRSTGNILAAANAVVAHNEQRKPKHLYTDESAGEKVGVYQAADERDEGRWIASRILSLMEKEGYSYDDFAVFYRTNAQSRILEDMLLRAGIPYMIAGGTRFFDRAEIRDVMAYLKLVVNPADDMSAKRVINNPKRGIGGSTVARIEAVARMEQVPFLQAAREFAESDLCKPRTKAGLESFLTVVGDAQAYAGDLRDIVELIVERSGLIAALEESRSDQDRTRIDNIHEFFGVAQEFADTHREEFEDEERALDLAAFMEWVALRSDLDSIGDEDGASVTMMTVHSAKGLEFPVVFVAGLEDSVFPHMASSRDAKGLEEERRLAYVAITRARKRLFLTYARQRFLYGRTQSNPPSRFISEIDRDNITLSGVGSESFTGTGYEKRGDRHGTFGSGRGSEMYGGHIFGGGTRSGHGSQSASATPGFGFDNAKASEKFEVGDHIDHKVFGRGVVTKAAGDAITVKFESGSVKKLMKGYAPIVKLK